MRNSLGDSFNILFWVYHKQPNNKKKDDGWLGSQQSTYLYQKILTGIKTN